ncbi:hypothetical protein, partial [Flavobacterium sp. FPG59]|uniref:hypothetical protein n=2 Tax=unclassified Flavobacterium TaxID=196869 RepID=UPI001C3D3FB5
DTFAALNKCVCMRTKFKINGSLLVAALWLLTGFVLNLVSPQNLLFTLILGLGIVYSVYILSKQNNLK